MFGDGLGDCHWRLVLIILLVLIAVIIDVTTHSEFDSVAQKVMVGLWSSMFLIFLILSLYVLGGDNTRGRKIGAIVMTVLIVLDFIWAAVLIGISSTELSTKEKSILYGRLVLLYSIPTIITIARLIELKNE